MSDITLKLIPKEEADELRKALREKGLKYSERVFIRDDASSPITMLGELVLNKEVAISAISLVGGWLAGRQGRKVKLKTDRFEAEAHNVEELKQVLALLEPGGTTGNAPPHDVDSSLD